MPTDISLDWGIAPKPSPSGGIATATGDVLSRQRVMRRLINNARLVLSDGTILAPDYLYAPDDGASLGRKIGSDVGPTSVSDVTLLVRETLRSEDTVDQTQPFSIVVTPFEGGLRLNIAYISAASGKRITLPTLIAA